MQLHLHPLEYHFSNTGFTSHISDSVMQKGKVSKVTTCLLVNCSPVEVVLWEELFVLTKGEIETCHDTRVYAKKQREEDEEKYERVGES